MKKLCLVCNAHIDPVWQWNWQEGVGIAISTFASAAKLCEEYDVLVFNHNESVLYEWVEKYDKALFAKITDLVKRGKWIIMGGWYLQPDCNMPCGESLLRQLRRGNAYFYQKFGVKPTIAANFDVFGTSRGVVQILAKNGYIGYVGCRPYDPKNRIKDFLWKGFNNTEILLHKASDGYCTKMGDAKNKIEQIIADYADKECCLVLWGVGNHGGGPSRADLEDIKALQKKHADILIKQTTLDEYFSYLGGIRNELPVLETDLNYQLEGTFTSQIRVKQLHQKLENKLLYAEKICAHASLYGYDYDYASLETAEKDLLFVQFHDILPGSSVKEGETFALRSLSHGIEICDRLIFDAFMTLSRVEQPAAEGEYPLLIYNPHPYDVDTIMDCELMLSEQNHDRDNIMMPKIFCDGRAIDCQLEQAGVLAPFDWRKRVVFPAKLKAGQITRYSCYFEKNGRVGKCEQRFVFTNDERTIRIDQENGNLSYTVGDRVILDGKSFKIRIIDYICDTWGFTYNRYKNEVGCFTPMSGEEVAAFYGLTSPLDPIRVIEDGPVRTVVETAMKFDKSFAIVHYIIPQKGTQFEVEIKLYNHEIDKLIKLELRSGFKVSDFIGKTAFGRNHNLKRNGDEVVAQDWVMLTDSQSACSVQSFGNYGFGVSENKLNISLLQSAPYCAAPPSEDVLQQAKEHSGDYSVLPQNKYTERIDVGFREFRFIINGGDYEKILRTIEYDCLISHQPPYVLNLFPTAKTIERIAPFVSLDNKAVTITSVTKEDGGWNFRFFNNSATTQRFCVQFGDSEKTFVIAPMEYIEYLYS